jgi:hypothetical protein
MLGGARILVTIAACMAAMPVAAQAPAPTTTAFDGTYIGVSRTVEGFIGSSSHAGPTAARGSAGGGTQSCTPNGQPGPLTIANGVARYNGSAMARINWSEGSVNAQGMLVMLYPEGGGRLDAQIDGRGTMTGRITGGGCSYHMVWQKQGT